MLDRLADGPTISGNVRDSVTGKPIEAVLSIVDIKKFEGEEHTTHPETGRFDRILPEPGIYDLHFTKEGYMPTEIQVQVDKEWKNYLANKALEEAKKEFNSTIIDVFELNVKGKSMSEIATDLGVAENTAYVYSKKVRDFIKEQMKIMDNNWG